jgi:hypothetical protein
MTNSSSNDVEPEAPRPIAELGHGISLVSVLRLH